MKILISNDDGVNAPGLAILASALSTVADITVIAPDRDRSAISSALTLDTPLRIQPQQNGFYAVNGTPTDCVHLAITGWLPEHPDMIVAGINRGSNLGDDVLYSGTVAAAMEGRFLGYPSMAISLVSSDKTYQHYATAATITIFLFKQLLQDPLPKDTLLNINVPDLPLSQIKGIKITRLGHRHLAEPIIKTTDPEEQPIYWIGPAGKEQDAGPGTDFYAVNNGFVSVTPIKTDLTDYAALEAIAKWTDKLKLVG